MEPAVCCKAIDSATGTLTETRETHRAEGNREGGAMRPVILLNQRGISEIQRGRDVDAEFFFQRALQLACNIEESSPKRTELPVTEHHGQSETRSICESPCTDYHRQDQFDEGMYAYRDAMPLLDAFGESIQSAILFYNIGQTHVRRGKYVGAKSWFERALVQLELVTVEVHSASTAFRVHHNIGHCCYRLGQDEEAMRAYQKALNLAGEATLNPQDAAATNNCIAILHFHADLGESNDTALLALFHRCLIVSEEVYGKDSKEVATVLNNTGRLHHRMADYNSALIVYGRALVIRRRALGSESLDVAATVCNAAQTFHQCGELDNAKKYYMQYLNIAGSLFGASPRGIASRRHIANVSNRIADIFHEQGELSTAKLWYARALNAVKVAHGESHPDVASILNKIGNLHFELQEFDQSLVYYMRGLQIGVSTGSLRWNHPHITVALMNIAQIHRKRGCFAEALLCYSQMHSIHLEIYGPNSLEVAATISSMGHLQYQLKNHEGAFEWYQHALQIQRKHCGEGGRGNAGVASTLISIGLVLFSKGILELAKACFTESMVIRRTLFGPDHRDIAILWYNLATICLQEGDEESAILLYKETLRIERRSFTENHRDVVLTLQHLAIVYQRQGELDLALECFGEALAYEREKRNQNYLSVGKLLNLIGNIHLQMGRAGPMMSSYTEASRIIIERCDLNEIVVISGFNSYLLSRLHPPCAPVA